MPDKKYESPETPVVAPEPVTPPPYVPTQQVVAAPASQDTGLATASMVMGIVSFVGFGFLLGIPAIITGAISIKQKRGGHGMGLAGIITGAISTFLSIILIGLWIWLIVWSIGQPTGHPGYTDSPYQDMPRMHANDLRT